MKRPVSSYENSHVAPKLREVKQRNELFMHESQRYFFSFIPRGLGAKYEYSQVTYYVNVHLPFHPLSQGYLTDQSRLLNPNENKIQSNI